MSASEWHAVTFADFPRLREARLQLHYAAQWLARAARAYVPEQPLDAHTNFGWDEDFSGLVTHPLKNGERVGLQPANLLLAVMDPYGARPARSLALNDRVDADARAWLGRELSAVGLDASALDAPAPYEMPPHAISMGARYLTRGLSEALEQLAFWYANANGLLGRLRQDLVARKLAAPLPRCWPHHFDLDSLVAFGAGQGARSMGLGFSPGDRHYDEPYFYVSLYPGPDITKLRRLPSIAHWHSADFTAAIVPAHKVTHLRDQRGEIEAAVRAAVEAAIATLS